MHNDAPVAERNQQGLTTAQVVLSMLTENTGVALCDSGGGGGRAWQLNQANSPALNPKFGADFGVSGKGPEWGALEFNYAEVNLYHWMVENLDFDAALHEEFLEFREAHPDDWDTTNMQNFVAKRFNLSKPREVINTYNESEDWDLTQTLQFVHSTVFGGLRAMLIQVHNGADVRGGYTQPKAFRVKGTLSMQELKRTQRVTALLARGSEWDILERWPLKAIEDDTSTDITDIPAVQLRWAAPQGPVSAQLKYFQDYFAEALIDEFFVVQAGRAYLVRVDDKVEDGLDPEWVVSAKV